MSSGQKPGQATDSIGVRPGSSLDTRRDLGYGRDSAKFHNPRITGSTFPYTPAEEDLDDVDLNLEIDVIQQILNKVATPIQKR